MEAAERKITKYGIALLGIVLAGAFLRIYQLGTQSIWYDEAFSIWRSQMSLPQLVASAARDTQPPLYYFLLHYWMMIFGTSEFALRLLSALFGILAIPMIYVVGRQLFNKEAGLVGALILALSWLNIWYSQETRMYSLMALLALLSMYFFWRFLQQSNFVSSVGYVLSTTLLVWTHYFGWFVVIAENIYVVTLLLLSKNRTYKLKHWVALQAIVLTLFVPWMAVLINQISGGTGAGTWLAQPTAGTLFWTFVSYSGTTVLLAFFLGLSVLSLFAYHKVLGAMDWKAPPKALESYSWEVRIQDPTPLYFLAVWLLAINLIPFIFSLFRAPIYFYRYTIAASVALYLLVARGTSNINYRPTKLVVIGVVAVLSVANLPGYYFGVTRSQTREATSLIDANFKSGDVVLIYPSDDRIAFDYYNNRTDVAANTTKATPSLNGTAAQTELFKSFVTGHDRVWFLYANPGLQSQTATLNSVLGVLNESYATSYVKSYVGYDVYLFEKRA